MDITTEDKDKPPINKSGTLLEACKHVRHQVEQEKIMLREDLVRLVEHPELIGLEFVGLWRHKDRLNPSLCFAKLDGRLRLFEDEGRVSSQLRALGFNFQEQSIPDFLQFSAYSYGLYVRGEAAAENHAQLSILVETFALIARRSINYLNIQSNTSRRISRRLADDIGRLGADPQRALGELFKILINSDDALMACVGMRESQCEMLLEEPRNTASKKKFILRNLNRNADLLRHSAAQSVPVVILSRSEKMYLCCYPIRILHKFEEASDFIVAMFSSRPTASFLGRFAQSVADLDGEINRARKLGSVVDAYAEIRGRAGENSVSNYTELTEDFREFLRPISNSILTMTESHSLTVRLFDVGSDGLRRAFADSTGTGTYDQPDVHSKVIRLRDFSTSVNSFCFLIGSAHFPYVYIGNCKGGIPSQYKELGLNSALGVRNKTQSEICFPLFFGEAPIGTLNLESSQRNAFDEDLSYLFLMKNIIEDRYRAYFDRIDLEWLRERTQYSDALHDLSNYLNTDFFKKDQKLILRGLFFPQSISKTTTDSYSISELKNEIGKWIEGSFDGFSDDTVSEISQILVYNGLLDLELPPDVYDRANFVIRQFINNIVNNAYPERDKIMVSLDRRFKSAERRSLRIRMKTHGVFEDAELDKAALAPIQKPYEDVESWHYGLYSVGLLSRSVGGAVHVGRTLSDGTTVIEADFPIEGVK